ncbi:nuclear transport factor 2 family protein [Algoriphagus resistens]|uniref:nuclear transport factor 2 family protein n=1 Tax=Algoriphagus resistens TaxID=1750590 RepID=UPI000A8F5028|nr:hypothetical protein [Algoriphagus resistens]
MKQLLSLVILLTVLMSCSSVGRNDEKNIALIQNYVEAIENFDHEVMADLLDANYLGLGPSFGDSIRKEQAVENWKYNVDNLYEKIDYTRTRNAAISISSGENQGEWVSNWSELYITYKDGRGTVAIWANSIYQIQDDKILKSYTFYNEADALRQLGYVFFNPNDL